MIFCSVCKKPLGRYDSGIKELKIELETVSSTETHWFDTKACLVEWVQKNYMTTANG